MNDNKKAAPVITVDGPSGAGKGTVCRLLAQQLGYALLDSGALYRLTALAATKRGIDLNNESAVAAVAGHLNIAFVPTASEVVVNLDGVDVSADIRTEQVGMDASVVAALPEVRLALLERQREFAQPPGLVADGRDMGTVVFPAAPLKIFLTASADERARRRYRQLQQAGQSVNLQEILQDIQARDERDAKRAAAPLKPAADARLLDSTALTIEQVVAEIMVQIKQVLRVSA